MFKEGRFSAMLVQQLKPWVTSFSAAIPRQLKDGDEVVIGGEITAIYDTSDILSDKDDIGVLLVLDDAIGKIGVILSTKAYQCYNTKYDLKVGNIVLAEGKVSLSQAEKHPDKDVDARVLSWKVYPVPSN